MIITFDSSFLACNDAVVITAIGYRKSVIVLLECIRTDVVLLNILMVLCVVNPVYRLVFLLQCAFKVLESCGGDGNSAAIPLTLGSAVRKFTKQTLRMNYTVTTFKQQVHFFTNAQS